MPSTNVLLLFNLFLLLLLPIGRGDGSGSGEGNGRGEKEACGSSNLNATAVRSSAIFSPNFPQNYPPDSECWWTITAPVGYHVLINFTTFDIESCCDHLQLYDARSSAEAAQPYLTIEPEDATEGSILSRSNFITMKFTSDSSVQMIGFKMIYRSIANPSGSSDLNTTAVRSSAIFSPNFPQNYPPDSECWWTITAPVGYHVLINFTTFDIESCCDHLRLYDARSSAESAQPYLTIEPEDATEGSILSRSNFVTMKFTSNSRVQLTGFKMNYRSIEYTIACPKLSTPSNGEKVCYWGKNNTIHCKFSCHGVYSLYGSERRWCQNGSWTGQLVTCRKDNCSDFSMPLNGKKNCTDGNAVGSICSLSCIGGYILYGSKSRMCIINVMTNKPQWYGDDASCQDTLQTSTCNVNDKKICDGKYDCRDQSDEKGCICAHYKFRCDCYEAGCPSDQGCIDQSLQCDGHNDCGDMSDERDCNCSNTRFQCKDGDCIDRSKVNDGKTDCLSGDDEFICNANQGHVKCDCIGDDASCTSFGRCIPDSWIGDTISDCQNHYDEPCNASKVWCDKCWVVMYRCSTSQSKNVLQQNSRDVETRCYSVTIPSDQTQKTNTNWICLRSTCGNCSEVFQCESGQIIDNDLYCDTVRQCRDGSDEDSKQFGFRCSGKSRVSDCVLPQENVYDSVAQCADSSDLCFVKGEFRCFSCLDGRLVVSKQQVCDGIVDCYDMSDECLCPNQSVCDAVFGEKESRCPFNQMHCYNDTDCVDLDKVLCNSSVDCIDGSNLRFCRGHQRSRGGISCTAKTANGDIEVVNAALCDERPECARLEDECQCEPRPSFCQEVCTILAGEFEHGNRVCDGYFNSVRWPPCDREVEKNCPMRFNCKSQDKISIDKRSLCNGIYDCDDHSDENQTECTNKRFLCTKGNAISIDKSFVCDGIKDCDNGEDETRELCGKIRFYCESGQPISIDKSLIENGIKDCSGGSDECISLFSDRYEMIASPILRALFWIMGLLALIGNLSVGLNTANGLFFCKSSNLVKFANDIFILNLTISDFLMGVYLIAVAAQGIRYSGDYCFIDKEWRSSSLCSRLATLAVLSSETSAFIMAAMSTFRLATVYNPFLSSSIKIKWVVITGCSCWILSILLAIVPRLSFDSGYFISKVWFPNMFLKTDSVSKHDLFTLAERVQPNKSDPTSWLKVKKTISDAFQYTPIKGEFGYYGETSVCMPRLFTSTDEAAWQYSTFLITLNFLLFIYMLFAYVLVYKKASGMKQSRSTKKDPNKGMQKRISRLLLTDFCCWIPVCMMGYLSVAGVPLPPMVYLATAGFLLPINSATNPILYSKFIGRQASRAKKWMLLKFSSGSSFPGDEGTNVQSCDTTAENVQMRIIEVGY